MKITRSTKLVNLADNIEAVEILTDLGLHCIGCFASQFETLELGCRGHGMSDEEIDDLIEKLNNLNNN